MRRMLDYYGHFDNFQVGVLQAQSIETALDLEQAGSVQCRAFRRFAGRPSNTASSTTARCPFCSLISIAARSLSAATRSAWTRLRNAALRDGATAQAHGLDPFGLLFRQARCSPVALWAASPSVSCRPSRWQSYGSGDMPMPVVSGQDAEVPSVKSILAGGSRTRPSSANSPRSRSIWSMR